MEVTSTSNALRQYQLAKSVTSGQGVKANRTEVQTTPDVNPVSESVESFAEVFKGVEKAAENLANGTGDAQAVVQALANAEVALETAVTIRNRVVEAYQELLRMPI